MPFTLLNAALTAGLLVTFISGGLFHKHLFVLGALRFVQHLLYFSTLLISRHLHLGVVLRLDGVVLGRGLIQDIAQVLPLAVRDLHPATPFPPPPLSLIFPP